MDFWKLLVVVTVLNATNALRILFILPCYGGHFGTMAPLIASLSYTNEVTVIATSELCRNKLKPFQEIAQFEVIEADLGWTDLQVEGLLDVIRVFVINITDKFRAQFSFLKEFLTKNKSKYDIMVTDLTLDGSLVAAEVTDTPAAVILSATSGAAEHIVDKMEMAVQDIIIMCKILLGYHFHVLHTTRAEHNLPHLVSQNNFFSIEYPARFPSLIATSPSFYPEPPSSVPHVFIGGSRNESHYQSLTPELEKWLQVDDRKVIYISLGTMFKLDEKSLSEFVENARKQNEYRFIWAISKDMQKSVESLKLESDETLMFSPFLPQLSLLGHEKVKLFVTHGGLGSANDLIKRRKPSICSPQIFDQQYNCDKMKSLGLVEISIFNFDNVIETSNTILANYGTYVANIDRLSKEFEEYENLELIEKFLADVASKGKPQVIKDFGFDLCSIKYTRAWMITKIVLAATVVVSLLLLRWACMKCCCSPCCSCCCNKKKNSNKQKLS